MTTAYTSLLGLALPVTGELSGTWGDTVNNSITSLLDTSVAGTTNVSTDTDVTLTTTTGAANTARQAILLFSGARTALRTVTAPAQSKVYTVINATTGGFSVKLVGAGPTTGVTIVAGESAVCAWNGSDFVKVSNTGGSASFTNVTVTGTTTLSGLTASTALALDASKNVVSVTNTGTGNNVLSASPTLTGTIGAASLTLSTDLTLSGGTANGVAVLNGSKVVTSGSALTFDGATLGVTSSAVNSGDINSTNANGSAFVFKNSGTAVGWVGNGSSSFIGASASNFGINGQTNLLFGVSGTESMRLTSTGLGIGTSTAYSKLYLKQPGNGSGVAGFVIENSANDNRLAQYFDGSGDEWRITASYGSTGAFKPITFWTSDTKRLTLDSSGNLGLGVTPSAWSGSFKALQLATGASLASGFGVTLLTNNAINDGQWKYVTTSGASLYEQGSSQHRWYNAPSGTAGNVITFTQGMTLDASSNLLVGTTSAMNGIGSDGKIGVQASGSSGNFVVQTSGDDNLYIAKVGGYSNSTFARFSVNGTQVGTVTTNGTSIQLGNVSGITFPATQSASADPNTLDDYEEGTWTPVWLGDGTNPTVTYSTQVGSYIKIGRMVYIDCRLVTSGATGGTGNLVLGGLPFATVNNGGNPGFTAITFSYGWGGAGVLALGVPANAASFVCYTQYAGNPANTQTGANALNGAVVYVNFGGCYLAAA